MAMYNHDMMHCHETRCEQYESCYRGWLDRELLGNGWTTAWYLKPDKTGRECKHYLNVNEY